MHCTVLNTIYGGANFDWFIDMFKIWFIPGNEIDFGCFIAIRIGKFFIYDGMNQNEIYSSQTTIPSIRPKLKYSNIWSIYAAIISLMLIKYRNVDEAINAIQK